MAEITHCGLCGSSRDLAVILDLGMQPLSEAMGSSELYPLALAECGNCGLVQLTYAVDQATVFPAGHPYATGNTSFLVDHFFRLAGQVRGLADPGDLIVDIGANDGTFLRLVGERQRRVAVEPTNQVLKARKQGIVGWQDYFTEALAREILADHGPAKVVTACNVLAHVPDPHDFAAGVAELLAPGGVLITENHDLASVTDGLQYDTVYHEHLRYWSLPTLTRLLAAHGLEVVSAVPVPTHGGSLRVTARLTLDRTSRLQARADHAALALRTMLEHLHFTGQAIYGIGATTRAVPLIHFAQIAPYIPVVCEVAGSEKIGQVMPATQIPVVDEARLIEDQPPFALILAWHIADDLVTSLRAKGYRGRFIVPLPAPEVLDA